MLRFLWVKIELIATKPKLVNNSSGINYQPIGHINFQNDDLLVLYNSIGLTQRM